MNKILFFALTASMLSLTGCGKKHPQPNGLNNVSDAAQIAGETVTIDDGVYNNGNQNSEMQNNSNANSASANGRNMDNFNSSSDGFKSIYFDFGAYGVSANMQGNMDKNIALTKGTTSRVKIEGNCDEFGTDEYNYALGLKRAKAVKDSIVARGVSASKLAIISFGESSPVCSSPTDSCYAQNRRVDLRLVK